MPEAGAEYVYLRETYGSALGFMSAFVSLVAGFSAPVASALKGLVYYMSHFFPILAEEPTFRGMISLNDLIAIGLVWCLVAVHLRGVRGSLQFNNLVTLFKIAGIVVIILAAAALGKGSLSNFVTVSPSFVELGPVGTLSAFATSLIFVMFCYSGWNAAAYVAAEMKQPDKNLPCALLLGTGMVLLMYLGLNAVYFYGGSVQELAGNVEVALVSSRQLFGPWGVSLLTAVLCVSMLASASAMTIAGPRVYYAAGRDFRPFRFLAATTPSTGAPTSALLLQGVVTSLMVLSGRVDQIQQYAGFLLVLFGSLAVSCVMVLRWRRPEMRRPFRAWGYPLTPLLFLSASLWMMFWAFWGRPVESLLSLLTVLVAGVIFLIVRRRTT